MRGNQGWDETTEVPLMALMFLAMVWHARRRERAAAAARAAREREREFIRRASHELRTPITVAKGYAEMVHNEEEDPVRRQEVRMILDELRRLSTLSERMLELAAMAHADEFMHREQVDVGRLVREVGDRWSASAARPLRVTVRRQGTISADRERLVAALDALIENAIHATEGGGAISIEADARDGDAVMRVVDTGVGIEPDELERIFQPFARSAKSSGPRGTGLGLPIVRAIVEGHGGRMHVTSEPGLTEFELCLPGFSGRDGRRRHELPAFGKPYPSPVSRM
jgi:signal transduction histidine kinase